LRSCTANGLLELAAVVALPTCCGSSGLAWRALPPRNCIVSECLRVCFGDVAQAGRSRLSTDSSSLLL
jgi:hypothetical protein